MWLDSLKAAGYSPNTLNTRRCQMSALSRRWPIGTFVVL